MDCGRQKFDGVTLKDWEPSDSSVVCKSHFMPDHFIEKTKTGVSCVKSFIFCIFMHRQKQKLVFKNEIYRHSSAFYLRRFALKRFGPIIYMQEITSNDRTPS